MAGFHGTHTTIINDQHLPAFALQPNHSLACGPVFGVHLRILRSGLPMGQQPEHLLASLHRARPDRFQVDRPDETDYGRIGIDNNISRSHGNTQPSPPARRQAKALEPGGLVQQVIRGKRRSAMTQMLRTPGRAN
jgi:hypothetical protein